MQLPKKKNWRMPRWSIRPSWSSANAPQGSSAGTGPVDSPPVALRWSMEIVLELLRDVDHRVRPDSDARVQAAAGRRQQRKARADLGVADADAALLVVAGLGARRRALSGRLSAAPGQAPAVRLPSPLPRRLLSGQCVGLNRSSRSSRIVVAGIRSAPAPPIIGQ